MRTTISHALDLLEQDMQNSSETTQAELTRVIRRVQTDYLEIIENALSLLVQDKEDECAEYLSAEREKLEVVKERIAGMISDESRWEAARHRLTIEYLFTRARLVDEIRQFPDLSLQLLERMTLDQTLAETIDFLESAMTGKRNLFEALMTLETEKPD